jgi:hypothetical protein
MTSCEFRTSAWIRASLCRSRAVASVTARSTRRVWRNSAVATRAAPAAKPANHNKTGAENVLTTLDHRPPSARS